jgi:diamine N-acetyltransferase
LTDAHGHIRRGVLRRRPPHGPVAGGDVSAAPVVLLREITEDNRVALESLAVTEEQNYYVASVTQSLQDAEDYPDAKPWYRAVYADDEPVGFVMISDGITIDDPTYVGPYYLWRLLIDRRFQGLGYGTATLDLVVEHVRTRPDARTFLVSHVVGPASPVTFYQRYGFQLTGEVHEGEPILELDLYPA